MDPEPARPSSAEYDEGYGIPARAGSPWDLGRATAADWVVVTLAPISALLALGARATARDIPPGFDAIFDLIYALILFVVGLTCAAVAFTTLVARLVSGSRSVWAGSLVAAGASAGVWLVVAGPTFVAAFV